MSLFQSKRVVITGVGTVCPVGNTSHEAFSNLVLGHSGIKTVSRWVEEKLPVTIGGEVKNFNPEDFITKKEVRRMGRFIHLTLAAAKEAWEMANLSDRLSDEDSIRAGTILGVGILGLEILLQSYDNLLEKGPNRVSPFFIPATISNLAPGHLGIERNLKLDNFTVVSACASGTHAIGEAFRRIKNGYADIMVAGGAESAMNALAVAGFANMQALCSSKNDEPEKASRPFSKDRDGFVMGEGAGIMVLEELEHAQRRDAKIIAEVVGYGSTCDAFHITAPSPDGDGAMRAMGDALRDASISVSEVQYINAHGTGTPLNDRIETESIKRLFGEHAKKLMVSSTKSMTGHLLGAAGGVEAVFTALSLKNGIIPPTINLEKADPDCDLDYVPNIARKADIHVAMSNSFGFGGANAVVVMKKYHG